MERRPTRGTWIAEFQASLIAQMGEAGVVPVIVNATRFVYAGYAVDIRCSRDDDFSLSIFVGEDRPGWIGDRDFEFTVDDYPADAADEVREYITSRLPR